MALGASALRVKYLVVSEVARPALYAATLGVALAFAGSTLLASRVVVMKTFDLIGYGGAILAVLITCGLAAFFPSRRASRVDPSSTLRNE
jgi:ABC-type antimicrobial peptide transport system permease subunit